MCLSNNDNNIISKLYLYTNDYGIHNCNRGFDINYYYFYIYVYVSSGTNYNISTDAFARLGSSALVVYVHNYISCKSLFAMHDTIITYGLCTSFPQNVLLPTR